jgi:hypothetical protein
MPEKTIPLDALISSLNVVIRLALFIVNGIAYYGAMPAFIIVSVGKHRKLECLC